MAWKALRRNYPRPQQTCKGDRWNRSLYNTKCQDNGDGTTTVSAALYKAAESHEGISGSMVLLEQEDRAGRSIPSVWMLVTVNNDDYMSVEL